MASINSSLALIAALALGVGGAALVGGHAVDKVKSRPKNHPKKHPNGIGNGESCPVKPKRHKPAKRSGTRLASATPKIPEKSAGLKKILRQKGRK